MLSAKRWPRTGPAASLEEARRTQASACLWSRPPNGLEMAPALLPRRRPCGSNSKKGLQTRHQLRSRLPEQCVLMADRFVWGTGRHAGDFQLPPDGGKHISRKLGAAHSPRGDGLHGRLRHAKGLAAGGSSVADVESMAPSWCCWI